MDYAGEEMNRQRLALAALLLGSGGQAERKKRGAERREFAPEGSDGAEGVPELRDAAAAARLEDWRDQEKAGNGAPAERAASGSEAVRARSGGTAGTLWRTGPFDAAETAFGGGDRPPDAEAPAGWRDGGTGVSPAGGGAGLADETERLEAVEAMAWTGAAAKAAAERAGGAEAAGMAGRWYGTEREAREEARRAGEMNRPAAAEPVLPEPVVENETKQGARADWTAPETGAAGPLSYTVEMNEQGMRIGGGRTVSQQAGAAEARALSLAFQRDARRYDGGFVLY